MKNPSADRQELEILGPSASVTTSYHLQGASEKHVPPSQSGMVPPATEHRNMVRQACQALGQEIQNCLSQADAKTMKQVEAIVFEQEFDIFPRMLRVTVKPRLK